MTTTKTTKKVIRTITLSELELAYLGGFFDGEGSVGLYWKKSKRAWEPSITIAQDQSAIIRYWFDKWPNEFGASVYYKKRSAEMEFRLQNKA